MEPYRKIIHVDMDAFYASVEQRDFPELKGKPIAVGGDPVGRGVVAAASYEARKFGVRSAMPGGMAQKLCPQIVFVPPRFDVYRQVSRQLHHIFRRYTALIEPIALDEAFLDVTDFLEEIPYASRIARRLKEEIRTETGLIASAGVGPNKFIAKLASDWGKPDGLFVVPPEHVLEFVGPLPIEKLWGVGPATAAKLRKAGLSTIGDLRNMSRVEVEMQFGSQGNFLRELAFGRDSREVRNSRPARSRGAERTFDTDLKEVEECARHLEDLAERVGASLRKMDSPARTLVLKVRFSDFETVTRSWTSPVPLWDAEDIYRAALQLLSRTEAGNRAVRLLGISGTNLERSYLSEQMELPGLESPLALTPAG